MRRIASIAAVLLLAIPAFGAQLTGAWSLLQRDAGRVQLNITREDSQHARTFALAEFTGLTDAQLSSTHQMPATFALKREAGTATFEGAIKQGKGGGSFVFTPNAAYFDTVRALGVGTKSDRKDVDDMLLVLAMNDVSTAYIRSMVAEGFRTDLDEYLKMRIFRVTPELVREMRTLGFDKLDADDIVEMQIHKVTPAFIRDIRTLGYPKLDKDDLVAFRIHRVTPEFVRELATLGYKNVDADDLVAMRIHRVTPEFIRELSDAGYSGIPVDKLVSMKIHGADTLVLKNSKRRK